MKTNKRYGWHPSVPDIRDKFFYTKRTIPLELPSKVDLRPYCTEVEDQGELGSCTANAAVGALEFLEKKDGLDPKDFSRLFVYYNTRMIEGSVNEDAGGENRDVIKTLVKYGACHENTWPYDVDRFADKPPKEAYKEGEQHQILSYYRITNLNELKTCLADEFPVIFGFSVYESFESDIVAQTGIMTMPTREDSLIGGHAVLAVGYDDETRKVIVRNSWGKKWGDKGYFHMPYQYISNQNLASDFWTVRRGENM